MSAVADVMDAILSVGCKGSTQKSLAQAKYQGSTAAAYVAFFVTVAAVAKTLLAEGGEWSFTLTLSSGVQCLGFFILSLKVKYQQTVAGLSSRSLEMYVAFFVLRLGTTLVKEGYLPVDASGDHVYQIADICSLMIVLHLIYMIHRRYPSTHQAEHDTLEIHKALPAILFLAYFVRGCLNNHRFFDWVWMSSCLVETVALLPQLWLLMKVGGRVESMTSHFVASLVVSKCLSFAFWQLGYVLNAPDDGSANIAGWVIIGCHGLQLLFCADFMYYYVKGLAAGNGWKGGMDLPSVEV